MNWARHWSTNWHAFIRMQRETHQIPMKMLPRPWTWIHRRQARSSANTICVKMVELMAIIIIIAIVAISVAVDTLSPVRWRQLTKIRNKTFTLIIRTIKVIWTKCRMHRGCRNDRKWWNYRVAIDTHAMNIIIIIITTTSDIIIMGRIRRRKYFFYLKCIATLNPALIQITPSSHPSARRTHAAAIICEPKQHRSHSLPVNLRTIDLRR